MGLALYQELISMGIAILLQSLVLVSKIAQFKSYAAGLLIVRTKHGEGRYSSVPCRENLVTMRFFTRLKFLRKKCYDHGLEKHRRPHAHNMLIGSRLATRIHMSDVKQKRRERELGLRKKSSTWTILESKFFQNSKPLIY